MKISQEQLGGHVGGKPDVGEMVYHFKKEGLYLISQIHKERVGLLNYQDALDNEGGYADIEGSLSSDIIPCFDFNNYSIEIQVEEYEDEEELLIMEEFE